MKILMVIGQFYPTIGGAERQCLKLTHELQRRGHEVKVITVWQDRDLPRLDVVQGITVERVWYPLIRWRKRVIMSFGSFALLSMALRIFFQLPFYKIVHIHQIQWPTFSATLATLLRKKPMLCKIGNSGERFDLLRLRKEHWYGRLAAWLIKRRMSRFIWTSTAVKEDLDREGIPPGKLVFIPNGVLLPEIPYRGERSVTEKDKTVFIFTGTFTLKKNLLTLIKAVQALPSSYRSKMHLVLLGDGPDRGTLIAAIAEYALSECVKIYDAVDDVGAYLESSDVFVLPSATEGLSNSALEAMAHGLPVILSNRGGNRDLVSENGILINPAIIEDLRDAIQYMIDHPVERLKMGERSRTIIEEKYAMEEVTTRYEELYRILV